MVSARALRTALFACALLVAGCPLFRRKHIRVSSVPQLPYPRCGERPLPPGEVIASRRMRSAPDAIEHDIVERFEVRRRDCLVIATVHQEWPMAITDVEAVYDASLLPLRVWKRMMIPGVARRDGSADIRRYELRTPEVTMTQRTPSGARVYEILRGPRPRAVIGPGRGLITLWLRRARLPVGGRLREPVLDVREQVEQLREVTLRREPDRYDTVLGRRVRVYTIYGREPILADDDDVVIGDMMGLRPSESLTTPEPAPLDHYDPPDPLGTP